MSLTPAVLSLPDQALAALLGGLMAPHEPSAPVVDDAPVDPIPSTLLAFMDQFEEFAGPSWDGWRAVLARLTPGVREVYAAIGRGAGKSRVLGALVACWKAAQWYPRAPGESISVGIFAPDRRQGLITFRFILGLLRSVPALAALLVRETGSSVELSTGVIIEVLTASIAAPRGRAYALVIIEEAAFLPTDQSANPDVELLRAVRPALARVAGSLLVVVSSPYARKGVLYQAWQRYAGQPDSDVVFVQKATQDLNPTFDGVAIAKAYADDPQSAAAEYGGAFRSDVETFVSREAMAAVVVRGRFELLRQAGMSHRGFLDFAGGASGGDAATLAIAHAEVRADRTIVVLDCLREVVPPFSPEQVCKDFAAVLKTYGVTKATADRWAGQFPVEQMQKAGITVEPSAKSKSELYLELLPIINSGGCELLDDGKLQAQLGNLERRTVRGGRDAIDHAPGGHDDVINAAAGALVASLTAPKKPMQVVQLAGF